MANARFIFDNRADDATLSASPALVASLPAANLQDSSRALVARSTGLASPQSILGDFSEVESISAMAIVRHNLTSAATIRLRLYNDPGQAGALNYDSGSVALGAPQAWGDFQWGLAPWGGDSFADWPVAFSTLFFDPVYALSFQLDITDIANVDGYYEISRLFLGAYWSPTTNISYGHEVAWVEQSTQERTGGGTLRTDGEEPFRRWAMALEWLTQGERAQLLNYARMLGLRRDFFFSLFPGEGGAKERDYAGAAKFIQPVALAHILPEMFRVSDRITFEEV